MQGFVGQQIDLEQYSKPYYQPMKGTKQWNTVNKWRRLCHQEGRLILNMLKVVKSVSAIPYKNELHRDDYTQEHLHVILHYPDQGNREYAADPTYSKSISCTLLIYVSGT